MSFYGGAMCGCLCRRSSVSAVCVSVCVCVCVCERERPYVDAFKKKPRVCVCLFCNFVLSGIIV